MLSTFIAATLMNFFVGSAVSHDSEPAYTKNKIALARCMYVEYAMIVQGYRNLARE